MPSSVRDGGNADVLMVQVPVTCAKGLILLLVVNWVWTEKTSDAQVDVSEILISHAIFLTDWA